MTSASPPTEPSGVRLLLIEDNDVSRQLMSDYLTNCGYHILCLTDPRSLGHAMVHFRPHGILLDLKLPFIDGYTVLEQLQTTSDWKDIPVLVVSAYAFRADRQRALELGAKRYLVKPVKLADLIQAIHEVVHCSLV
jgi:two-component system, cell cycle response regulator DivK